MWLKAVFIPPEFRHQIGVHHHSFIWGKTNIFIFSRLVWCTASALTNYNGNENILSSEVL